MTFKDLEVPEVLFMWRAKFRKNLSFEALGANLAISKHAARRMFWTLVFEYFEIANQIPRVFVNPDLDDSAKNEIFQKMYDGYDPLHKVLSESFHGRLFPFLLFQIQIMRKETCLIVLIPFV